jgi:hypothetical protein
MNPETKEAIDNMISYYRAHSIEKFVKGDEERLQNFVIEDFTKLLALLEKELENA